MQKLWPCWTLKDILELKQNTWWHYCLDSCMYDRRTCVRKVYIQNCIVIWTLEACENWNWNHTMLMPWIYVCKWWACSFKNQMVICMGMTRYWEYYCVRLDEMHVKDWKKEAHMLRPRIRICMLRIGYALLMVLW
jgi:predicted alpha-1,6-mannanase (GH76 family)